MSSGQDCVECRQDDVDASQQPPEEAQAEQAPQEAANAALEDPLSPATFVPPAPLPTPNIVIEFCDRCRWQHRATWVSTELMLTFPTPSIRCITLLPQNSEATGGRFRVWLTLAEEAPTLIWDRKVEGGFPELKVLKQRIRDRVQPGKSLGHSDKKHETQA
ncbi:Rdx family protein [Phanerochaete sordida]|uniref:Rdx family protein n=1 Tax=Phanerochaete sordida TaxID=48140 RepID=A0A9P3FXY9_9APHY|nr:Rdx family protein [Phanerochaete sordida]